MLAGTVGCWCALVSSNRRSVSAVRANKQTTTHTHTQTYAQTHTHSLATRLTTLAFSAPTPSEHASKPAATTLPILLVGRVVRGVVQWGSKRRCSHRGTVDDVALRGVHDGKIWRRNR